MSKTITNRSTYLHVIYNLYDLGASVEEFRHLTKLCASDPEGLHFFLCAPQKAKLTDYFDLLTMAKQQDERVWSALEQLLEKEHNRFSSFTAYKKYLPRIGETFKVLESMLGTLWILQKGSETMEHFVETLPFRWLFPLLEEMLKEQGLGVKTFPGGLHTIEAAMAQDNYQGIVDKVQVHLTDNVNVILMEGNRFDPATGEPLTDRSASTIAAALKSSSLTLWHEKNLLLSCKKSYVPGATVIDALSYAEFTELSYFRFNMVSPRDLLRSMKAEIPIYLRSLKDVTHPGTCISHRSSSTKERPAKGFTSLEQVALVNIEGAGMAGVPGIASQLFASLRQAKVSVCFISQASSEHSICIGINQCDWEKAYDVIHNTFRNELHRGIIEAVHVQPDCAIVAAVGQEMAGCPGIATRFFGSLSKANINVKAIAQGSSEQNISAVVSQEDVKAAIRALHSGFFLSNQTLSVGLIGPGLIGGTLLAQIAQEQERLKQEVGVDIRVRGIIDTDHMVLSYDGLDCNRWKETMEENRVAANLSNFVNHIDAHEFPHPVLIDCTSSDAIAMNYLGWVERGIHIITPNKKGGTAPMEYYQELMKSSRRRQKHFLYETTVGAGLPIIGTLKDLIQTGDRVHKIEGIFSGTLSYLFWRFDGTVPFSQLVLEAKDLGFTEPDPRDDLSGMDIVRKTVILARENGAEVELTDVDVASLVPKALRDVSLDEFLSRISEMDAHLQKLYEEATANNMRLRYVGTYDKEQGCTVALKQFPLDHPFSGTKGTDNIIAFSTARYNDQPLVIQGPGAGPEVTAGGIFADLLRLGSFLGPRT